MYDLTVSTHIAWAISAIFAVSALVHATAPRFVRDAYERWGFPPKFYRITALMDLLIAAFMATPPTRIWGVMLAGLVTFIAIVTLLNHRQYAYAVPGMVILAALVPASLAGPF